MTRRSPCRDFLDELPPWPRPLVMDLRHAPELAVLAVLHHALRTAMATLAAEHPLLADLGPGEPPTVRLALSLVDACLALGASLDGYRRAAIAAFRDGGPEDRDLPF